MPHPACPIMPQKPQDQAPLPLPSPHSPTSLSVVALPHSRPGAEGGRRAARSHRPMPAPQYSPGSTPDSCTQKRCLEATHPWNRLTSMEAGYKKDYGKRLENLGNASYEKDYEKLHAWQSVLKRGALAYLHTCTAHHVIKAGAIHATDIWFQWRTYRRVRMRYTIHGACKPCYLFALNPLHPPIMHFQAPRMPLKKPPNARAANAVP